MTGENMGGNNIVHLIYINVKKTPISPLILTSVCRDGVMNYVCWMYLTYWIVTMIPITTQHVRWMLWLYIVVWHLRTMNENKLLNIYTFITLI